MTAPHGAEASIAPTLASRGTSKAWTGSASLQSSLDYLESHAVRLLSTCTRRNAAAWGRSFKLGRGRRRSMSVFDRTTPNTVCTGTAPTSRWTGAKGALGRRLFGTRRTTTTPTDRWIDPSIEQQLKAHKRGRERETSAARPQHPVPVETITPGPSGPGLTRIPSHLTHPNHTHASRTIDSRPPSIHPVPVEAGAARPPTEAA